MSNFVQAKGNYMIMYAKFQYYNMHGFLYLISSRLIYRNFLHYNNAQK
jgi:hypothetical protein